MDLLTFDFDALRTARESTNFYYADGLKEFTNFWLEWAQSETGARHQNFYWLLLTFSFLTSDDSKYQLLIWQEVWNSLLTSDFGRAWECEDCLKGGGKRLTNFWFGKLVDELKEFTDFWK